MRERQEEEGKTKEERNQHIVESWIASYNVMTHTIKYVIGKKSSPFSKAHAALQLGSASAASTKVDDEKVTFEARQRADTPSKRFIRARSRAAAACSGLPSSSRSWKR